ncbi:MAG: periplasmic heavy metal sensor [Candidatus Scalindua sp.]|nr:periplasmic heavy metal sensor [Candidatus Scalindua sp.]
MNGIILISENERSNSVKVTLKQFVYSLCIIVVMLFSSNVYSQTSGDRSLKHEAVREKMKARMLEIFKQLNLSPEQEKQLKAHRNKHRESAGVFRQSIRAKKEEIRIELQEEVLNMEKINKLHSELKNLYSTKADHRLEGILEVRKILTPQQFRKFSELRKDMRAERKGRGKFN